MAISATTAEDTWFNGQKTRLSGFGGGMYNTGTSSDSIVDDLIDADAVISSGCSSSTPTKVSHRSVQFRDASNKVNRSDADDADEEVSCESTTEEEYYGRRLLDAFKATAIVSARRSDLPFRRKKSYLFKRKRRPNLSNVVEIYEQSPAAASGGNKSAVFSECKRRDGGGGGGGGDDHDDDNVQNSKTRSICRESCVGGARASVASVRSSANENGSEFAVAGSATSLISVSSSDSNVSSGHAAENKRLLSSAYDIRDDSNSIGSRNVTLSKSYYLGSSENFQPANGSLFSNRNVDDDSDGGVAQGGRGGGGGEGGSKNNKSDVNYAWSRRRTCPSLGEEEDGIGEIGIDSEERVVLLQRSASVPDDDALSTPPAKRTTKATSTTRLDNIDDVQNSVPLLSSSKQPAAAISTPFSPALTSSASKRCKSIYDLKVPSLKSLVTMATHKLSASRPANLNYWRNGGCNGGNNYSTSTYDSPVNATLRRNISLNNVASRHSANVENKLKNASSNDIAGMCLLNKKMRKCNTMLTLSGCVGRNSTCSAGGQGHLEPLRMVNRLRVCSNVQEPPLPLSRICSRCSSLLSMASSSRYSLNSTYGFVPVSAPTVLCKVCLNEVPIKDSWTLQHCECSYCVDCVRSYVEFEINQGAYSISCPDAQCEKQGIILLEEIESLVSLEYIEKHKRYRLNREVEMDKSRTWCPRAGCETVCTLCSTDRCTPQNVQCPTCNMNFCSSCRASWHADSPCKSEEAVPGVTFDSELIKCCPMCSVPIEKDEGCAQMLCKRCKHVFCWYCLASLDDDFLLRHYDKGPCKNKLGHSRASVIWHRTQVISIFAGFGILLLIASPLLLLAAPCIVCCKCRVCTSDSKLDADDDLPEVAELQPSVDVVPADQATPTPDEPNEVES